MFVLSHTLVGLALFGPLLFGSEVQASEPLSVEVFTTSARPMSGDHDDRSQGANIVAYAVDGLVLFESTLSERLPTNTVAAKAEVLSRIQHLDEARMASAKNAATGLAKAVQYGIDRYPAIVFSGTAVVYGVTDLVDAVERYDAWIEAQSR